MKDMVMGIWNADVPAAISTFNVWLFEDVMPILLPILIVLVIIGFALAPKE